MIEIRRAERDDVDALCDTHVESWRVGYRNVFPDQLLDSRAFADSRHTQWSSVWWLQDPRQALFAGTVDGRVLGFANVGGERSGGVASEFGRGEIYAFYVHPSAWGTGLAVALIAVAEAWLREQGRTEAVLWVLRDNPRARAFYEKSGWSPSGVETMWEGPQLPDITIPEPVAQMQYGRTL